MYPFQDRRTLQLVLDELRECKNGIPIADATPHMTGRYCGESNCSNDKKEKKIGQTDYDDKKPLYS